MANLNVVAISGNLTRDPELRALPSGTSVCELSVAVGERYKDGASGEWLERANFFDVTVWGAQGENCAKYLSKGRGVVIQGRLRFEQWEKDGQKRSRIRIVADMVQFLNDGKGGGAQRDDDSGGGYRMGSDPQSTVQAAEPAGGGYQLAGTGAQDDIPF